MKKLIFAAAIPFFLSGCFDNEKTYTVSELEDNAELRQEILAECRENPGELGLTPNCVNADEAEKKASSSSSVMPSI